MVGSHVPKTTEQLQSLWEAGLVDRFELNVAELLDPMQHDSAISRALDKTTESLLAGRDVVVFTSRERLEGKDAAGSLEVSARVSGALVKFLQCLGIRPRYLIAKGGITSSDLATRGLGVKRAWIEGQLLPGVPVWRIGEESRFPGLPYVVFPGNVGCRDALTLAIRNLNNRKTRL